MIAAWSVLVAVAAAATGFDHVIHEGRVIGSVAEPPTCADCHASRGSGTLTGAPGHAACFGACHGEAPARPRKGKPYPLDTTRRRLCATCHAPDELARVIAGELTRPRAAFPPYAIDPDYTLVMPHARHASAPCGECHATPGSQPRARRPHERCASCHARPSATDTPSMQACATCHRPAFGPAVGPTLVRGALPVTGSFDHVAHAARLDGADDCLRCHDAIAATDSEVLPTPPMERCATCHDGERAFATTATRCRSCHPPSESTRPASRARTPFSHARHARHLADRGCADCHTLEADGAIAAPGRDHQPCADGPCHADDFAALRPVICSTCHVGNEPWRALKWFPLPDRASEYALAFSHEGHGTNAQGCTACHAGDGANRAISGGHRSCAGANCHARDAGRAPLAACERCHTAGATSDRAADAPVSSWSVATRFRHDLHGDECTSCHRQVAPDQPLSRPTKQQCARCHDGGRAFKMTGHACSRCHAE